MIAAIALAGLLLAVAWVIRERTEDPVNALQREPRELRVVGDSTYPTVTPAGEERIYRELTIETHGAGTIRVTISTPATPGEGPFPLLVILAGLRTGRESLNVLPAHGRNVLVGYQYPYDQTRWYERMKVAQVPTIRRAVLDVPWQVSHIAGRLRAEPYVDGGRTALLGYSFGAMFVPATQRLAAADGHGFGASIMAFGGVDIEALIEANLDVRPAMARRAAAWMIGTLVHAVEPAAHLPHIEGRFLIIRGSADRQIPGALSDRLAALTPPPREVVTLEAGHMGPGNPEVTDLVLRLSREWLVREGVIEPLPAVPAAHSVRSSGSSSK